MLISEDSKSIYIGESDNVLDRLNNHYSTNEKTEYWVKTMVFVADGNYPLNISQIKYIESKLLEYAKSVAQVHIVEVNLKNKKPSLSPNINTNDKVVAENFLSDIVTLTKTLGIDYFDISKTTLRLSYADESANLCWGIEIDRKKITRFLSGFSNRFEQFSMVLRSAFFCFGGI